MPRRPAPRKRDLETLAAFAAEKGWIVHALTSDGRGGVSLQTSAGHLAPNDNGSTSLEAARLEWEEALRP